MKPEEFTEKTLAFLGSMGVLATKPKFYVQINFDAKGNPRDVYSSDTDTVFRVAIHPTQWSLFVNAPKKQSSACFYADGAPEVQSDAFGLFVRTPRIADVPSLLRASEKKLGVAFPRVVFVRTNLAGAKKAIGKWAETL